MLRLIILSGIIFSILLGGLTTILQQNYETDVSPNWFLYTYIDETNIPMSVSLYLANLDTGEKRLITDRLSHNGYGIGTIAEWSPDGHWLYFKATDQNGQPNLYRQYIYSSTSQIVIPNWEVLTSDFRDYGGEFRWSPDGQWIIHSRVYKENCNQYNECQADGYVLYRMRLDGSDVQRLSNKPTQYRDSTSLVMVSPDNQWLYFKNKGVLYRTTFDGQNIQQITEKLPSGQFSGWSLDEQWVYFTTYHDQNAYPLYRMKLDGSDLERLLPLPEDEEAERFSLVRWIEWDKTLIYQVDDSYYLLNIQTGEKKHLMDSDDNSIRPQLSADGQWMFVTKFNRGLYRLPVGESAEPEWLVQGNEIAGYWADDYSGFYYRIREGADQPQYYRLDVTTFEVTQIDHVDYLRVASGNMFSPNNQYVLIKGWKDLCSRNLKNQHEECLNTVPQNDEFADYEENFLSWMPPFVDKSWHASRLYLFSGLFLLLVGGFNFYKTRNL